MRGGLTSDSEVTPPHMSAAAIRTLPQCPPFTDACARRAAQTAIHRRRPRRSDRDAPAVHGAPAPAAPRRSDRDARLGPARLRAPSLALAAVARRARLRLARLRLARLAPALRPSRPRRLRLLHRCARRRRGPRLDR